MQCTVARGVGGNLCRDGVDTACLVAQDVSPSRRFEPAQTRERVTKRLCRGCHSCCHSSGGRGASIRVRLSDRLGHNPNLDFTLADATDVLAELRTEGKEVFVHCAEARSRTAAVGALCAVRHRGVPAGKAWRG